MITLCFNIIMNGQEMSKKFNKGEWSEFYVFIKILSDKKIFLLDDKLNKLESFYEVLKILRKEVSSASYIINDNKIIKKIDDKIIEIEVEKIKPFIPILFNSLKNESGSSFLIKKVDDIFKIINSNEIKIGSSYDKSDITLVMKDDKLLNKELGFNIKSYMGNAPTLLNSSMATNFIYEIEGYNGNIEEVNNIETKSKIRDRILYLIQKKASIKFKEMDNSTFNKNLRLVDTLLPEILSISLLNFYSGKGRKINEVSELLSSSFLSLSHEEFTFKVKSFLLSIALGMVPTKTWDGFYSADGYIVVKSNGEIGCFSVLDKKILADYLYNKTKFDTPSSSRHDYGYIYKNDGKLYIKLNLQIRF